MISLFTVLIVLLIMFVFWQRKVPQERQRLHIYENKPVKRAIDHYQIAAEYDYTLGDRQLAYDHYLQALQMARETPVDTQFILERIGMRIQHPRDEDHQFALDLQRHWDIARAATPVAPGAAWHEDTQNVHDTLLSDTVVANYRQLQRDGASVAATPLDDIMRSLQENHHGDSTLEGAVQMLGYINRHNCSITKLNDTEPRLVQEVWKQVQRVGTRDIRQSFCTSLHDSWNGGSPHCVTGRNSRVIQSLAYMIPDRPQMGQLKTREALRNEIFHQAGRIVEEETDQKTDESTRDKISDMVDSYVDIAIEDRERIKLECYAGLD